MTGVTVVITTFNLEKYISRCLDELFSQTMSDFDILIIDDCSTDKTPEILSEYEKKYPDKITIRQLKTNLGSPAKVRNFAIDTNLIDGEYTVFLDGDDNIESDFLETLYNTAKNKDAEIAFCAYDRVEEENGHILCTEMQNFPEIIDIPPQNDILAFINGSLWNKIIKTSLFDDVRIPDFKVGEDLTFQLKLFQKCNRIASVNRILIHYKVRKNSVISNTEEQTIFYFAEEFLSQYKSASSCNLKSTICLEAFIHIGVSMAIRAYQNPSIKMSQHLKWTRNYILTSFNDKNSNSFLKLSSLKNHGVKGLAIWTCKILYKIKCFRLFLITYSIITKIFHVDFKF